jgi:sulfur carrier protein
MANIKIYVNGKEKETGEDSTIQDILKEFDAKSPMLVVERNFEIVPKDKYDNSILREGDQLEIVGFFGGG